MFFVRTLIYRTGFSGNIKYSSSVFKIKFPHSDSMYNLSMDRSTTPSSLKCSYVLKALMSNIQNNSIVWVDLEMTGLNHLKDHILEFSCLITDKDLNITAEGPDLVIHQPDIILNSMNDWSTTHHAKTGLTEASRNSKISLLDAENEILKFLKDNVPERSSPLAGNSIYVDRFFITQYMPRVDAYLHYRIIDVSTIKELCKRWNPSIFHKAPKKKLKHRSLDDIKESIQELQYYKHFMFQ